MKDSSGSTVLFLILQRDMQNEITEVVPDYALCHSP